MPNKNLIISAIRMLCTVSIVIIHILQQYTDATPALGIVTDWLNLALVMFFSISAFLYSSREIKKPFKWLSVRYLHLIIPSLLTGILTLVIFFLTGHTEYRRISDTLIACLGFEAWCDDSWLFIQLWFLSYILFCYVTVPLIQKIRCKECSETKFWLLLAGCTVIVQLATYLLEHTLHLELLSIGVLLRFYLPYFILRRYDIHSQKLKRIMLVLTAISVISIIVCCILRYTTLVPLPASIQELVFIYSQTLAGTVCFYWLYHGIKLLHIPHSILKISDKYSYPVYLTHCLFIGYSPSVIRAFHYSAFGIGLSLLLTVISSIIIQALSHLLLIHFSRNARNG